MDELTISVIIADRPYRLTIKRDEEETIRRAANKINETIKHYSKNYAFNDKQDLLAMVALENTTNALRHEDKLIQSDETISAKLSEIDLILSDNLKTE